LRLNRVEAVGFRGLIKEEFHLEDLTVFSGEMGSGKTSRLLAILYCLTGSAPPGLNLDDLINVNSDFMWVRAEGVVEGRRFKIERGKKRGRPSTFKTDLETLPDVSERVFIDGREISKLFIGAPAEKAFKIDALLGLSHFNQVASEVSTAHIDRRIEDLKRARSDISQVEEVLKRLSASEDELRRVEGGLAEVSEELKRDGEVYLWAEDLLRRAEENARKRSDLERLNALIRDYEAQLSSIPTFPDRLIEDVGALEKRYEAVQKRIAFLEAVMQILDLEGRRIEEIPICPVCGALISSDALDKFKHYDEEYRSIVGESAQLEVELKSKRDMLEDARRSMERVEVLQSQIARLREDASKISLDAVQPEELKRAEEALSRREELKRREREFEVRRASLREQIKAYRSLYATVQRTTLDEVDRRIERLNSLKERLQRIKGALIDALGEARSSQIEGLRASFREVFKKIYPYERLREVDFEAVKVHGREVIQVKGRVDDRWLYPNQMSTGENVAVSLALLFAASKLETAPILLFDEPEEGLDENGVYGLAEILNGLRRSTQIVVATRSAQLPTLLHQSGEVSAV